MSKMLSPMELYHAARETCVRLYVANGGNVHDKWTIKPFPGTAAISCRRDPYDRGAPAQWTLCMPSFPLEIRLPRWKADLVGAYTVHELLHALWTDWDVVAQSRREHLHSLVNALEDNRIEWKANTPALVMVTEARRLLEALNDHIAKRAMSSPGFALDDPKQFSFVLNLVIFHEKHKYVSPFPANWRALVRQEWLPMFDLALSRFDALQSTADVLRLAQDLKALAAKLPKPKRVQPNPNPQEVVRSEDGAEALPPMPLPMRDAEITERAPESEENEEVDDASEDFDEDDASEDFEDGANAGEPNEDDNDPTEDASEPANGEDDDKPTPQQPGFEDAPAVKPKPSSDKGDKPEDKSEPVKANEGANELGGRSDHDPETEPAEDLSDNTQVYDEANLNDLSAEAAKDANMSEYDLSREATHAATILNVPLPKDVELTRGGDPKLASRAIESPAKLRRHLTMAVKSPERVANERYQVSGRLDLRNVVGMMTAQPNVFRRRTEEEGREAAVSILIDVSGSMAGSRLAAAKAMSIHMGDALKAAGVKFEIAGFDDVCIVRPKAFADGWAEPARRKVAGLRCLSGTGMLPAMKACAERLLHVGNVTRRILLVLTDGQDSYAAEANAALCAFYAGRGVEIVGIGLQTNSVAAPFRGKATVVWSTQELSTNGLKLLVKILDAGAPRAG